MSTFNMCFFLNYFHETYLFCKIIPLLIEGDTKSNIKEPDTDARLAKKREEQMEEFRSPNVSQIFYYPYRT